jgi:hypothetical protein
MLHILPNRLGEINGSIYPESTPSLAKLALQYCYNELLSFTRI